MGRAEEQSREWGLGEGQENFAHPNCSLINRKRARQREQLLEPQLPRAPSLRDTVIQWLGLEKCYETPESSVSSRWIITLLLTPVGLVLSPSTPALEMKPPRDIRRWEC